MNEVENDTLSDEKKRAIHKTLGLPGKGTLYDEIDTLRNTITDLTVKLTNTTLQWQNLNNKVKDATIWRRVKYLFTGKIN